MLFEIFFKIGFSLKSNDFDFEIVNFPFLDGDVPRSPSYCVHISQLSYGVYTRVVQEIRGQMLPFPQFLTERSEICT